MIRPRRSNAIPTAIVLSVATVPTQREAAE